MSEDCFDRFDRALESDDLDARFAYFLRPETRFNALNMKVDVLVQTEGGSMSRRNNKHARTRRRAEVGGLVKSA